MLIKEGRTKPLIQGRLSRFCVLGEESGYAPVSFSLDTNETKMSCSHNDNEAVLETRPHVRKKTNLIQLSHEVLVTTIHGSYTPLPTAERQMFK